MAQTSGEASARMTFTLSGFGSTPENARAQALLVAQASAELLDSGTIWAQLLGSAYAEGAMTLPWLSNVFASSPANASPGWNLRPGECTAVESDSGTHATSRVKVRWGAGTQVQASSDSLALAIEEARRRSCHGAWATRFSEAFRAIATADASGRDAMFSEGVAELNASFATCMSSSDYDVGASRHPRIGETGPEFCEVATAAGERTFFVGKAQGHSRAHALERASIQSLRSTLRATHSELSAALSDADIAMRAVLLSRSLSNGIHAIGAQSIGGNARSRCAPVEHGLTAEWHPSGRCGDGFSGAVWNADVCDATVEVGRAHVRDAVAAMAADADSPQAALFLVNAFGVVSGCAHECGAEVQVSGVGTFAQTRGAHCRSESGARAIVERGIEERNLSGLLHCAGPALFGRLTALYQEQPERFWEAMSGVREELTLTVEDGFYWFQMP